MNNYQAYNNLLESLAYINSLITVAVDEKESLWSKIKGWIKKFKNLIIAIGVILLILILIKVGLWIAANVVTGGSLFVAESQAKAAKKRKEAAQGTARAMAMQGASL